MTYRYSDLAIKGKISDMGAHTDAVFENQSFEPSISYLSEPLLRM